MDDDEEDDKSYEDKFKVGNFEEKNIFKSYNSRLKPFLLFLNLVFIIYF